MLDGNHFFSCAAVPQLQSYQQEQLNWILKMALFKNAGLAVLTVSNREKKFLFIT